MSLPIVLRDEAQAEFDEAFDFYEANRPSSGVRFANRDRDVFRRIAANPEMHPIVRADIRKVAVPRYPYRIFYRAVDTHVEILAVFHTSRNPRIWQGRI